MFCILFSTFWDIIFMNKSHLACHVNWTPVLTLLLGQIKRIQNSIVSIKSAKYLICRFLCRIYLNYYLLYLLHVSRLEGGCQGAGEVPV